MNEVDTTSTTAQQDTLPDVTYHLSLPELGQSLWWVKRLAITEELSGECRADVSIENDDAAANQDELLGTSATLALRRGEITERRFSGIIRSVISQENDRAGRLQARIVIEPAFKCLDERIEWAKFVDLSVPDILRAVLADDLGRFGREVEFRLIREHEPPTSPRRFAIREYTAQRGETRYMFVRRLCSEEGLAISYDNSGAVEKLIISDDNGQFPRLASAPIRHRQLGENSYGIESVGGFEVERRRVPRRVTVQRFDLTRPRLSVLDRAQPEEQQGDGAPGAPGDEEIYDPTGAITLHQYRERSYTEADTAQQARLRLEAAQAGARVGRGHGNVVAFRPGLIFTLAGDGYGESPLDGEYLITAVRHSGEAVRWSSGSDRRNEDYANQFTCIPIKSMFRPPRIKKPRAGFDFAVVATISDQDPIHHDRHGRVRLKFTWDATQDGSAEKSSGWVPVSLPWAGAGFGIQALPRKGMTVLVQYEHGDPDRPVVVGAAPTADTFLPFALRDKATVGIRTQSQRLGPDGSFTSPHFNELSLSDAAGSERFFERAGWNFERRVLNDSVTAIDHDERYDVGNDQKIGIDHDRSLEVGGNETVKIKGDRADDVRGTDGLTVGGDRSAEVTGCDKLTVHSDRHGTVDGDDQLHVKKNRTATVDGTFRGLQGPTTIECADGHVDLDIGEWIRIKHGPATVVIDAAGAVTVTTSQKIALQSGGASVTLDDGKVAIAASKELALSVGSNAIKLDEGGITSTGTNITESATVMHQTTAPIISQN